jgi:hypothetical protein
MSILSILNSHRHHTLIHGNMPQTDAEQRRSEERRKRSAELQQRKHLRAVFDMDNPLVPLECAPKVLQGSSSFPTRNVHLKRLCKVVTRGRRRLGLRRSRLNCRNVLARLKARNDSLEAELSPSLPRSLHSALASPHPFLPHYPIQVGMPLAPPPVTTQQCQTSPARPTDDIVQIRARQAAQAASPTSLGDPSHLRNTARTMPSSRPSL